MIFEAFLMHTQTQNKPLAHPLTYIARQGERTHEHTCGDLQLHV